MGVNKAVEEINEGYTDQQLKDQLAQICASAPALYKQLCQEAESKADEVLAKIHAGETADQICGEEGYCDNGIPAKYNFRHLEHPRKPGYKHRFSNGLTCDLCKMGIDKAAEEIAEGYTDQQLKDQLHQICASAPALYKKLCEEAEQKADEVLPKIHAGESSDQICKEEGYCDNVAPNAIDHKIAQRVAQQIQKKLYMKNDFKCDICKMGVDELDKQIAAGKTDEELKAELAQICASVPALYKQLCNDVQSKEDEILAKARAGETADQLCKEEGYC